MSSNATTLFATLCIVIAAAGSTLAKTQAVIARGQAILEAKCVGCHAIGKSGASSRAQAPPFRDLHRKYDVSGLAEALAEGIVTGHPDMPVFVFSPTEISEILTYLDSLK